MFWYIKDSIFIQWQVTEIENWVNISVINTANLHLTSIRTINTFCSQCFKNKYINYFFIYIIVQLLLLFLTIKLLLCISDFDTFFQSTTHDKYANLGLKYTQKILKSNIHSNKMQTLNGYTVFIFLW